MATALDFNVTGGKISTGIYTASLATTAAATPLTRLFDVWHDAGLNSAADADGGHVGGFNSIQYKTGSITPKSFYTYNTNPSDKYVSSISNLRSTYSREETARFRLFIREKDWSPTIYSRATREIQPSILESASYSIYRIVDDQVIFPHGTASTGDTSRGAQKTLHTMMSYDVSGNYFDFDISLLENGYSYGISLAYYNDAIGSWVEQPETFKFKVESRQRD